MKNTESNICQITAFMDGRPVLSETYHGYSKDDCCHIASATKSIVGLLVGIAPRKNFFAANADEHIHFTVDKAPKGKLWLADPQGIGTPGYGLCMSAEEMCRIGQLCLQKGAYEGKRLISEQWIEEMTTGQKVGKNYTPLLRVELWNDGALPDGVTQDTLMKEHSSRPRNKNIAYAMFKAGFIEVWGRGWKKICDEFSAVGLPIPTIESVQGGTKVCFKRPTNVGSLSEDVGSSVGSLESAKLTDRQKNICKMLIINPHVSAKAMSEVLSVVPRTIERELSSMQKAGVIRHEGKTSGGKWVVLIALE